LQRNDGKDQNSSYLAVFSAGVDATPVMSSGESITISLAGAEKNQESLHTDALCLLSWSLVILSRIFLLKDI